MNGETVINKLILVEGIPGVGKTTTARKLKEKIESQQQLVRLYQEGESHPADMAWNAYLTKSEYNDFIQSCLNLWETSNKVIEKDELLARIEEQVRREDDRIILAYTRIDFPEECYWSLIKQVASKEIFDGRVSFHEFKQIHLRRWKAFAEKAFLDEYTYIFECAFLQNHIFELLGVYEKSNLEIYEYLCDLLETVKPLNPCIVYIEPTNIEKIINQAASERKSQNSNQKDWIDEITDWVSNINYGKSHNLKGIEGVYTFCKERFKIDKWMLQHLDIPVETIKRD